MGYSSWGHKESDATEGLTHSPILMSNHATNITPRVRLSLGGLDSFEKLIKSMDSLLLNMHTQELSGGPQPPKTYPAPPDEL